MVTPLSCPKRHGLPLQMAPPSSRPEGPAIQFSSIYTPFPACIERFEPIRAEIHQRYHRDEVDALQPSCQSIRARVSLNGRRNAGREILQDALKPAMASRSKGAFIAEPRDSFWQRVTIRQACRIYRTMRHLLGDSTMRLPCPEHNFDKRGPDRCR